MQDRMSLCRMCQYHSADLCAARSACSPSASRVLALQSVTELLGPQNLDSRETSNDANVFVLFSGVGKLLSYDGLDL